MSSSVSAPLKKTPLNAKHRSLGARMVEFAGWDMPVEYTGITQEHLAVRQRAGLFDVSHMGEIEVAGPDALPTVQWLTSNDVSKLANGQIQYSALTTETGTFVDDLLVYRLTADHYLLVVNAGNIVSDHEWIVSQTRKHGSQAAIVNSSSRYALLALQGPAAERVLQTLTAIDLSEIKYYRFATGEVAGIRATVSRTGYTGEDGFEVFVPPAGADTLWDAILAAGRTAGVEPCGLGARDTLRLEAGMRLHGNDMDRDTSVLEAGLGWIVGWKKESFLGSAVLKEQKAGALTRKLAAFEMSDRAIARHGHPVMHGDRTVGVVTSGTQTPFLRKAIGFAMVPIAMAVVGGPLEIDIRGRRAGATIVPEPFYKRSKS
jgi:aminomethyltransferase